MDKLLNSETNATMPFIDNKGHEMKHLEPHVRYTMVRHKKYILVLREEQIVESQPKL